MDGKNLSIVALVCGILGIVGGWIPVVCYFTFVLAVAGIVCGAIGMKKSKAVNGKASGLAIGGLVCGIIGTVFGLIGILCAVCALCVVGQAVQAAGISESELQQAFQAALQQ